MCFIILFAIWMMGGRAANSIYSMWISLAQRKQSTIPTNDLILLPLKVDGLLTEQHSMYKFWETYEDNILTDIARYFSIYRGINHTKKHTVCVYHTANLSTYWATKRVDDSSWITRSLSLNPLRDLFATLVVVAVVVVMVPPQSTEHRPNIGPVSQNLDNNTNTHQWNYKAKPEAKSFCQKQRMNNELPPETYCDWKAIFNPPLLFQLPTPYPYPPPQKKVIQQHQTWSVFVHIFVSVDKTRVKSVLVSFPSPEMKMEPSNGREVEESYWWWRHQALYWNLTKMTDTK